MASRAEEESGGRCHQYDNEGLEPDEPDGRRHRDHKPYSRPRDEPAYPVAQVHTSRRPKHPDSAQRTPGEDDAYVTLKNNSERPRRYRRDRNRSRQPDSDTHRYGAGDAHVRPDDHSPHSGRDNPHAHQPTQLYAGKQNFEKAAAAFGSGDPYADSRAKVHESRRKKDLSQAKKGAAISGDEEQPNTPYKNDDDNDDEPSSSNIEDIEMMEMGREQRNGGREQPNGGREQPNGGREQPNGEREQPNGGREQPNGGREHIKSWSELDDELSKVKKYLNKNFKPIFDQHSNDVELVEKLRAELNRPHSQQLPIRDSIAQILNGDEPDGVTCLPRSYDGFVSRVVKDLQAEVKEAFRRMLLSVVGSIGVLPKRNQHNFLANYKLCPPPLFIPIITLIQLIIFAAYVADMEDRGMEVTASSGYPVYSPLPYMPARRWQAWRFFTYMFIHAGYLHILYNVIAQLLLGLPLEVVHGCGRTAIIYLTGVTAGSLAHSVVDPGVGLVGASGGVYAIMGAHLAAVVTNWKEMNYKVCDQEEFQTRVCCAFSRILVSAPSRMVIVVLLVLLGTGPAIFRRVALDEDLKVGVSAHVGGFLTGLFLGIPVLKNVNKHVWETNLGRITLVVFLLVCAFAVSFNVFFDEHYPPTDWS